MFTKVLVANRGAIACRIFRTLRAMEINSVAVYSEADRHSLHVLQADEAVCVGAPPAAQSYLNQERIIAAAQSTGAQAIHPGYGFLSENADFATRCENFDIRFIGPTPQQMRDFGLKHTARVLAERSGVPLLPGTGLTANVADAKRHAARIGYPIMLKSTAGGGGIGMQLCRNSAELESAFESVERLARNNFSDGGLFLEKYIERARHIEVQIFGDGKGNMITLGERDCSVQRRNQKIIEETPAPGISQATRGQLTDFALRLARAVNYRSAGTVEFVYDVAENTPYFLEVNTRLQVEHGVTEQVTGIDLVEWMIRVAADESPDLSVPRVARGHSIQVRVYAEDPARNFRPSSGLLTEVILPTAVRVDSWIRNGTEVSAYYDPLLAKIISHGETRQAALDRLTQALDETRCYGIETNLDHLRAIIADDVFREGAQYTNYLSELQFTSPTIEIIQPGTHSTVQDYPGRIGYWDVGVPPSGPIDSFAFRMANRILGNPQSASALELTATGPTLRFASDAVIALTGATMQADLDSDQVEYWKPIRVKRGSLLRLGSIKSAGQRAYLAVQGGFDIPAYMGSCATFTLGQFGGHGGRALRAGDVLRLRSLNQNRENCSSVPAELIPAYSKHWDIKVTYGPHGAPEFFTKEDIDDFFAASWEVHYHSSRTGIRLIGPKPRWARRDGGEAGLHPSNIHDNAYAIGTIDYTGDMPVILGPDGPSLGGFVCPATIVQAERWKMGQLRPGDTVRFHCISMEAAVALERALDDAIATFKPLKFVDAFIEHGSPIIGKRAQNTDRPQVCYRQAGDKYVLVEYGPQVLDLELRFRVHALTQQLADASAPGVLEFTPGIRSLQVHYDSRRISQTHLLEILRNAEDRIPAIDDTEVPSRIVHLPLSWDDPATRLAIDKYTQSVRADAPWCPSNIEFIRRINGLDSVDDVRRIVFDASYLVLGLGDVYLGAPVATPLDPRHRLVTTKYNPARTWTPENAVGIGGAYLCIYGMEGPGGYQFIGRTLQMWNRYRQTADFRDGKQWLLRPFDQIRFYSVSAAELSELRENFVEGRVQLRTELTALRLHDYRQFLRAQAPSIALFKSRQQAAFEAEREQWRRMEHMIVETDTAAPLIFAEAPIPAGCQALASPVIGSVWQLMVSTGDRVRARQELLVVEAMKMEIPLSADVDCIVIEVRCTRGKSVIAGEPLVIVQPL